MTKSITLYLMFNQSFKILKRTVTVNSEILARVLFLQNFLMPSFQEIKSSRNGEVTLSFTDIGKSCPSHEYLMWQILTLFARNKILAKISGLTVF